MVARAQGDAVPEPLLLAVFVDSRCLFAARRQLEYGAFVKRFMTAEEFVDVCDLASLTQTVWVKSRQPLPIVSVPQLGATVVGQVPGYVSLRRLDESGDYLQIRYGDVEGYVYTHNVARF